MLISCVYIVFILYLSCATPLSPAMHAQLRHKITFRLYMIYLPDHSRIYRNCTNPLQPIYLVPCMCLSCVTILIARHATRYPTPPPTTPPLPHKPFPEIPQIPRCIVRPHRPTDDSSSNTHNSPPTTFILCLSYAFLVFTLCHCIQPHILHLSQSVAADISCVYHALILCLSCVAFSRQSDMPRILHMTVRPLPYPCPI